MKTSVSRTIRQQFLKCKGSEASGALYDLKETVSLCLHRKKWQGWMCRLWGYVREPALLPSSDIWIWHVLQLEPFSFSPPVSTAGQRLLDIPNLCMWHMRLPSLPCKPVALSKDSAGQTTILMQFIFKRVKKKKTKPKQTNHKLFFIMQSPCPRLHYSTHPLLPSLASN